MRDRSGDWGAWISGSDVDKVPEAWGTIEYPIRHLEDVLRAHIAYVSGHQEILNRLEAAWTETTRRIVAAHSATLTRLVQAAAALLNESVPSEPIGAICERFWALEQEQASLETTVRELRMIPELRQKLPGNRPPDKLVTVSAPLEAGLLADLHEYGGAHVLAVTRS
jgi:hypothetical protein